MPHHPTLASLIPLAALALSALAPRAAQAADYLVYYGSPNGGAGNGISLGHFDSATGALTKPQLAVQAEGPSFFTIAPDGKHLYACLEASNQVAAYEIDAKTGALKLLGVQPAGGDGPCHISLDKTGKFALVANYNSGSVAVFPIQANGSLGKSTGADQHFGKGPNTARQEGPHGHGIITDPTNRFALCADLGTDKIYIYKFDEKTGTITPNDPAFASLAPGAGPRHVIFSPNGKVVYCINELNGTLTAFNWDSAKGALTELQTLTNIPGDFKAANKNAEIMISPNGKYLFASNRGHDSIAVFSIDPQNSKLTLIDDVSNRGKTPRYFGFDPTGQWIISGNQDSNTAVVFRYDAQTGKLTPVGEPIAAPAPICMLFLPAPKS